MARPRRGVAPDAPISIYEVHLGSWGRIATPGPALPDVRRDGRPDRRPRPRPRLHPRRAAADHGAPVLRLVGLPDHRLLRADGPLRLAAAADGDGRPPAPARRRRDPRLGAVALPDGRPRARPLRRHAPLRARRPAPGLPPRLDVGDLQLRPARGALVPHLQRAVLARPLPRRRAARRRRGVDALPRLLPRGRASGSPTASAAARTSRRSTSCASSTTPIDEEFPDVATFAEESTAWPMVTGATAHGGLGFDVQVGHGVDARHAAVRPPRSGAPPLPPRRGHVPQRVRVHRALRAAAVARRGRPRQGLAARQDARRRLAALRQPAPAVRDDVGPARQEAAVHGRRAGDVGRSGTTTATLDWGAPRRPAATTACGCGRRAQRAVPRRAGAGRAATPTRPGSAGSSATTTPTACSPGCASTRPAPRRRVLAVVNATPTVHYGYRIGVPAGGRWTELLNSDADVYGGSGMGNLGARRRRRPPVARLRPVAAADRARRSASSSCARRPDPPSDVTATSPGDSCVTRAERFVGGGGGRDRVAMSYEDITFDVADDGVATLTHQPARGDERAAAADDTGDVRRSSTTCARNDAVRCLVITGDGPRLLRRRRLPGHLPRRGPRQPQDRPPDQPHQARRVVARRHLRAREADDRRHQRARRRLRHGHRPVLRHPHRLGRGPSSAGSSCAAA